MVLRSRLQSLKTFLLEWPSLQPEFEGHIIYGDQVFNLIREWVSDSKCFLSIHLHTPNIWFLVKIDVRYSACCCIICSSCCCRASLSLFEVDSCFSLLLFEVDSCFLPLALLSDFNPFLSCSFFSVLLFAFCSPFFSVFFFFGISSPNSKVVASENSSSVSLVAGRFFGVS